MTQRCRSCGCSNLSACLGGCWWVDDDLCSSCATAVDVETGHPWSAEEVAQGWRFGPEGGLLVIDDEPSSGDLIRKSIDELLARLPDDVEVLFR